MLQRPVLRSDVCILITLNLALGQENISHIAFSSYEIVCFLESLLFYPKQENPISWIADGNVNYIVGFPFSLNLELL